MRKFQPIFYLLVVIGQSCAVFDGYKDNQHSVYSRILTPEDKLKLDRGQILAMSIKSPGTMGQLIVMKGTPTYGPYNFIETGDWKEHFEYSSGNFVKGEANVELTYDSYGNILKKTVIEKQKGDNEFHTGEIWTSEIQVFDKDTVLTQKIVGLNRGNKMEITLAVLNYKEMLSDRLKTKVKVGTEKRFDDTGKLTSSTDYKFQDKVKYR